MVLTFYEELLAEGRERRAKVRVQWAKRYIFPHFTRGLRHHRYYSVALRGFFIPEKRNPRRLVVSLVFRCLIPSGKETNRKRWVDREVNHPILPFGFFLFGGTTSCRS